MSYLHHAHSLADNVQFISHTLHPFAITKVGRNQLLSLYRDPVRAFTARDFLEPALSAQLKLTRGQVTSGKPELKSNISVDITL